MVESSKSPLLVATEGDMDGALEVLGCCPEVDATTIAVVAGLILSGFLDAKETTVLDLGGVRVLFLPQRRLHG